PQVNGVASSVYTLAHSLREQGYAVLLCTTSTTGRGRVSREGPFPIVRVPAVPFPFYSDVRLATPYGYALTRLVRRFAPDIIHCHTSGQFSKRLGQLILERDRRAAMGRAAHRSSQR